MYTDINVEQYQSPAVEYQVQSHYSAWEQQKQNLLQTKINFYNLNQESKEMFLEVIDKLHIPQTLAIELFALCAVNIYLVIDDSQSMAKPDTELYENNLPCQLTRIEELKIRLRSIAPILSGLAKHDIQIKLLSNVDKNITIPASLSAEEKLQKFNTVIDQLKPESSTPLISATTLFARDAESAYINSRNKTTSVLYIFTDGKPSDKHIGSGQAGVLGFNSALHSMKVLQTGVLSIGISACTGDEESIGWLTDLDNDPRIGKSINVQDDFFSEALSMYRSHGSCIPFNNYGFYIATGLLAPIVPWIDNLNEKEVLTPEHLAIACDKEITNSLYAEYLEAISELRNEQWYQYYTPWKDSNNYNNNFELEIVSIDGKQYRQKHTQNKVKTIYDQCTIL